MMNKPELKNAMVFIGIILVFSLMYIIINNIINNKSEESMDLKNYEVNEYIPVYVTDEDMAKIYFNEYIYIMYSDVDKAYNLLDEDYRTKKFGSVENYENYINSLDNLSYKVDSFYIDDSGKNKIYGVYDTNGNIFIFETSGIMQYKVYLDNYTVEI